MSTNVKSAHLTLTPHHLFYLLSRVEELGIAVGPMNVRIESIHSEPAQSNYVSFLQSRSPPKRARGDSDSIHSVSSVRSVMSGMSAFWSSIGLGSGTTKTEKAKAAIEADLKYLYSACTKLPSLRLTSDPRARLIKGYEEFPFDTAVPLFAFKNIQQLDIVDMDFRQFHGWDRLADQLCLLTVKRANVEDLEDLLTNIVLDDAEKRRRRSTRNTSDAPSTPSWTVPSTPTTPQPGFNQPHFEQGSPEEITPSGSPLMRGQSNGQQDTNKSGTVAIAGSVSPKRPTSYRPGSSYRHARSYSSKVKRSGSGSSNSSDYSSTPQRSQSATNLLGENALPASKWQRLKYLSLADNALTNISAKSIAPLTLSLRSLNLASNLFNEIPDSISTLTRLTSLDMSNCMIESLQSLSKTAFPAITTLKLKSNRLQTLAGIERMLSLENLDLRDNRLSDAMEIARLTGMPNLRKIWVKHNPFVRKFPDYRVTIMNLFRKTPGYTEDIIIDDQPASYAERKLLIPRVPEIERRPVVVFSQLLDSPEIIQTVPSDQHQSQEPQPSGQDTGVIVLRRELSSNSTAKRKTTRRRIVDLAKDNVTWVDTPAVRTQLNLDTRLHDINSSKEGETQSVEVQPAMSDTSDLDLDRTEVVEPSTAADDYQHDDYRAQIESLRQQFGSNWLSALSGQHLHAGHLITNEAGPQNLALHHSSPSVIVTNGRSLG